MQGIINDDDLTHQIGRVWYLSTQIKRAIQLSDGVNPPNWVDQWRQVQTEAARYVNSEMSGL